MKFQYPSMHGSQDMACIRFHSDFFQLGNNKGGQEKKCVSAIFS